MPPSATTMNSLKDDNVEDILLRLPSWASLGHAVRASDRFRHIASDPDFLRRFRVRHASSSSPHSFLGVFSQRLPLWLPVFHLADPGLVAAARTGDFLLAGLEDDPAWCMHDCRSGRLLLSKGGSSLTIYDPISLRRTDICRPGDDPFPNGYIPNIICLIDDDGDAPFRVVFLQVDSRRRLRVVEYDSRVDEWRFHHWAAQSIKPPPAHETMYASGLLFWHQVGSIGTSSLMLDTRTMEFSMLCLPAAARWMVYRYSIGETEVGECCLICMTVDNLLQVWLLKENSAGDGSHQWEFHMEKPLIVLLAGHDCDRHYVGKVVAGLVIIWGCNCNASKYHHYAIDIKNFCLKAIFSDVDPTGEDPFILSNYHGHLLD